MRKLKGHAWGGTSLTPEHGLFTMLLSFLFLSHENTEGKVTCLLSSPCLSHPKPRSSHQEGSSEQFVYQTLLWVLLVLSSFNPHSKCWRSVPFFAFCREVQGLAQGYLVHRSWDSHTGSRAHLCSQHLPPPHQLAWLSEPSWTASQTLNLYFLASPSKMDTLITDLFF